MTASRSIESPDAKNQRSESQARSSDSFWNPTRLPWILCFRVGSADHLVTPGQRGCDGAQAVPTAWALESVCPQGLVQWEIPRLCRGGSRSLTFPRVGPGYPWTKLQCVSRRNTRMEFQATAPKSQSDKRIVLPRQTGHSPEAPNRRMQTGICWTEPPGVRVVLYSTPGGATRWYGTTSGARDAVQRLE